MDGHLDRRPKGQPDDDQQGDDLARPLRVLGLSSDASWEEICAAHNHLVSDLTPGADANHHNVALAEALLREVNDAFSSLQIRSVA